MKLKLRAVLLGISSVFDVRRDLALGGCCVPVSADQGPPCYACPPMFIFSIMRVFFAGFVRHRRAHSLSKKRKLKMDIYAALLPCLGFVVNESLSFLPLSVGGTNQYKRGGDSTTYW